MTDFSKIKTIDELAYQTERMERRASIQRERLDGHADYIVREWQHLTAAVDAVVTPLRDKANEYRSTFRVVRRIAKAFLPDRKK